MRIMKKLALLGITILLLTGSFYGILLAETPINVNYTVTFEKADGSIEPVISGQKGVDYALSSIYIAFDPAFEFNAVDGLEAIKVIANGKYDETDKFTVNYREGNVELSIPKDDNGDLLFQLRPQTLYNICIPQGMLCNAESTQTNSPINLTFVTRDEAWQTDLLVCSMPGNGEDRMDNSRNTIELQFVDEIVIDPAAIAGQIAMTTAPIAGAPPYDMADSMDNYTVASNGTTLILTGKNDHTLKDFAQYTITLQAGAVKLKNSPDTEILNEEEIITFTTDRMLKSVNPANNQEGVSLEPKLEFEFKYPINIMDKSKIYLGTGTEEIAIAPDDITLGDDGTNLIVDVNDAAGNNHPPLQGNTSYEVIIEAGAVRFADYPDMQNKEIKHYFITGSGGESPVALRYSSGLTATDDITDGVKTSLTPDGSVYIHFDRPVKWDRPEERLTGTALYQIPGTFGSAYDPAGRLYDKGYAYDGSGNGIPAEKSIPVGKVEIVGERTICITPEYPLLNLNSYRLNLKKELIEDLSGYNMENDIDVTFWTKASTESLSVQWVNIEAEDIQKNDDLPFKSYTVYNAPQYGPDKPIILNIDGEVIRNAGDTGALERIVLIEGYDPDQSVGFSEYKLEYDFAGDKKKTKLILTPSESLHAGKYYRLTIAGDVLQTRSGQYLPLLDAKFVIKSNATEPSGIYGIAPESLEVTYVFGGQENFAIKGYNFHEDIEKVVLTPIAGEAAGTASVEIGAEDICFNNTTQLTVKIRGDRAAALGQNSASGTYTVNLYREGIPDPLISPVDLKLNPKGSPVVKAKEPDTGDAGCDEKALNPVNIEGTIRYFMKITFEDLDGSLAFNEVDGLMNMKSSYLYAAGGSEASLIDSEFINHLISLKDSSDPEDKAKYAAYVSQYIFVKNSNTKDADIYIPIKLLRPQSAYTVMINPDIVYYKDVVGAESGNPVISWEFNTMTVPMISRVSPGSVIEDYDPDVPIIIEGDFFNTDEIEAYFNDTRAAAVRIKKTAAGKSYLEAYLPSGSHRLDPGVYTVSVRNDRNHQTISYGTFSVIQGGDRDHLPNTDYRLKKETGKGDVQGDIEVSADTLQLKSSYTDRRYLELDLDDLMGEAVWTRKIRFEGKRGDEIDKLCTLSKWADITLHDVTLDSDSRRDDVEIRLGRAEPGVADSLRGKLRGQAVKSDFIEVGGKNYTAGSVRLAIPYKNGDGYGLKALRYDETLRNWYEASFYINSTEKKVEIDNTKPGIFVIIQQGGSR